MALAGKSKKEIAAKLGMEEDSFGVRLSNIRKSMKKKGVDLPKLTGQRSNANDWDALAAEAKALMANSTDVDDETDDDVDDETDHNETDVDDETDPDE